MSKKRKKKSKHCSFWDGYRGEVLPDRCLVNPVPGLDYSLINGEWVPTQ